MKKETPQERQHHPRSPSGLQMEEACPMFARRNETNAAAEKGTRQHAITETGKDDDSLSDKEVFAAVQCMEFADQQKQRLLKYGPVEDIKEIYLPIDDRKWMAHIYNPETHLVEEIECDCTTGGYVDRVLIGCRGRVAIVADWKFGKWPIEEAVDNLQGISYVLGLFQKYPKLRTVDLYFKQPHIDFLTHHRFQRRDIDAMRLRVITVVERADRATQLNDYDRATPCIPACLFCARKADCHKMHNIILKIGQKFHPIEFPDDMNPSMLQDPKNFAKGMRLQQIATTWGEAYRRRGVDFILTGQVKVPEGFMLVRDVKLQVANKETFRRHALNYLTEQEYLDSLKPGLTSVGKAIQAKMPRGEKGAAVEKFRSEIKGTDAVEETAPIVYLKAAPKKKDKPST
jgi:hypothetical protein